MIVSSGLSREEALSEMTSIDLLRIFGLLLFPLIALFYLFRLIGGRTWLSRFDGESEAGHALMAIGMVFMLAPAAFQMPDIVLWNAILFAAASLWFTGRLLARRPLLALVSRKKAATSAFQADAIHIFMNAGMCYMFLLMRSMVFSMMPLAVSLDYGFCLVFLLLTLFYAREVARDVQPVKKDWLALGANVAHVLMSGAMVWMFLGMIAMNMSMQ